MEGSIIFTGYLTDEDKNALYKNTRLFLFPSVFEGFGIPPIEATFNDAPVLVSKIEVLEEITCGLVNYVDNPLNQEEWLSKMINAHEKPEEHVKELFRKRYNLATIAEVYISIFKLL